MGNREMKIHGKELSARGVFHVGWSINVQSSAYINADVLREIFLVSCLSEGWSVLVLAC